MATPAEIQAILETSRYMPEAVQILEDYVQQQCQQCTYDFEPNLAIIKLYQFFPEKVNRSILAKVLVKALMNLPATDFLLCMYLIPERMQAEEPVNSISNLANLLETCRFAQFWEEAKAADDFLGTIPGFEAAIRSFILGVLSVTFQRIQLAHFKNYLKLEDDTLLAFLERNHLSLEGDIVVLPLEDNRAHTKGLADNIRIDQIAKLLPLMTAV
mmetsp:Transcript_19553/g.32061  ORF Transcript_19553/g.32061 Transcript_19553/m.32061 type:complete len:214 (-) Transcript_19553:176-817(-)|eukprot:CAMPEP_0184656538 /NCGR_PEP_ID=MMETSP0308-20130426/16576_1 /TAXON_ID=38269 /ORGANISM="Gloeochaete witrockiana, Strain SAG 46.84" /LENGTH=213 /DNA_ID=CAMNT_0027093707 /DNA_START=21 /DNA_END=662 /DNA_ORIENTATION=+